MLKWFGIGEKRVLSCHATVTGVITGVRIVKSKKADDHIRRNYYLISFRYCVNGVTYRGKRYIGWFYRAPIKGEKFMLHYDPAHPRRYAMRLLGPAII